MALLLALFTLLPLAAALFAASRLVRVVMVLRRIIEVKTSGLGQLEPGRVEVAGTLHSDEPLVAPSGEPCVALFVRATGYEQKGNKTIVHPAREVTRMAPCVLKQGRRSAEIAQGEPISVQGKMRVSDRFSCDELTGEWREALVKGSATTVRIEEHIIEPGATVLIHAEAHETEAEPETYRDNDARFVLTAASDEPILVMRGTERAVIERLALIALAMAVMVSLLFVIAIDLLRAS